MLNSFTTLSIFDFNFNVLIAPLLFLQGSVLLQAGSSWRPQTSSVSRCKAACDQQGAAECGGVEHSY